MRVLTVPNLSFGRSSILLTRFDEILGSRNVKKHYLAGDVDHNRTVAAFSGEFDEVESTLFALAEVALPEIDLRHHEGQHPRVGALDVCPFVPLDSAESLGARVDRFAAEFARVWSVPVFLYEKSERGRHEAELPRLRRGGFEALLGRAIEPDFGPPHVHPRLGATVVGERDWLIAMNVNLGAANPCLARELAREIRVRREQGDPVFSGVRAMGFALASRAASQVSMNITLPDVTPVDPIVEWVMERARHHGVAPAGCELIGVIRDRHVKTAELLPIQPEQVVQA